MGLKRDRVFIIGLDGATWKVLRPLMDKGDLPNLASIVNEGVSGTLESTIPPLTAPAWTTFQTGLNVGSHGIYDFLSYDQGSYMPALNNSTSIRSKTIWQIASEAGKTVVTIAVPMTFPPRPVNGASVGCFLTPNVKSEFTYPDDLFDELVRNIGDYRILTQPTDSYGKEAVPYIDQLIYDERKRFEAAEYLMKKYDWDLFMIHFHSVDVIQHAFWHHIDKSHPAFNERNWEKIREFYVSIDAHIGKLRKMIDDDTKLIIMSDHGFGVNDKYINLNEWLRLNGFQVRRKFFSFVSKCKELAKKSDVFKLRDRVANKLKQTEMTYKLYPKLIDWKQTKAFVGNVSMYGHIYLNVKGRESGGIIEYGREYDEVREEIIMKLMELKDPETGENAIRSVVKREDAYHGSYLKNAPDLIAIHNDGYCFSSSLGEAEKLFIDSIPGKRLTGQHRKDGIFIARGRNINKNTLIDGSHIVDLAPTILYCLSLPVPREMEGRVLTDMFNGRHVEDNPVLYSDMQLRTNDMYDDVGDRKEVVERLKDLGYL